MLLYIWQLPQNLLGLLIIAIFKGKKVAMNENVWIVNQSFGISLGQYIILGTSYYCTKVCAHELGHCYQSLYLGPFYIFIIGIPSIIMNLISQVNDKFAANYYNRFPENWADKLGGVER